MARVTFSASEVAFLNLHSADNILDAAVGPAGGKRVSLGFGHAYGYYARKDGSPIDAFELATERAYRYTPRQRTAVMIEMARACYGSEFPPKVVAQARMQLLDIEQFYPDGPASILGSRRLVQPRV